MTENPTPLTEIQKANLRLTSAEIAVKYGTKMDFSRDVCLKEAEKIYKFAIEGITGGSAPEAK